MEQQKIEACQSLKDIHAKEMEGSPGSFGGVICFCKDFSGISSVDR